MSNIFCSGKLYVFRISSKRKARTQWSGLFMNASCPPLSGCHDAVDFAQLVDRGTRLFAHVPYRDEGKHRVAVFALALGMNIVDIAS